MPSPFPGMDPYLESPAFWRDTHHNLITAISSLLNRDLPRGFAATIDERIYIVPPDRHIFPDMAVLNFPSERSTQGGVATLAPPVSDSPLIVSLRDDPIYGSFIEVRTTNRAADLIAVIELLSPANKELGSEGRAQYLRKQREVMVSDAHLLEIDLLRTGEHTIVAEPGPVFAHRGAWNYVTCLHRAGNRSKYEVWPTNLRDPLPRVAVPLTDGLPDTLLDLQAAFNRTYDTGPYVRLVDYEAASVPPLSASDDAWADVLLRTKGLRL